MSYTLESNGYTIAVDEDGAIDLDGLPCESVAQARRYAQAWRRDEGHASVHAGLAGRFVEEGEDENS